MQDGTFYIDDKKKKKKAKEVKSFGEDVVTTLSQPTEVSDWGEEVTTEPEKKNLSKTTGMPSSNGTEDISNQQSGLVTEMPVKSLMGGDFLIDAEVPYIAEQAKKGIGVTLANPELFKPKDKFSLANNFYNERKKRFEQSTKPIEAKNREHLETVLNDIYTGDVKSEQLQQLSKQSYGKDVINNTKNVYGDETTTDAEGGTIWDNLATNIIKQNRKNGVELKEKAVAKIDESINNIISNYKATTVTVSGSTGGGAVSVNTQNLPVIDFSDPSKYGELFDQLRNAGSLTDADGKSVEGKKEELITALNNKLFYLKSKEPIIKQIEDLTPKIGAAITRINMGRERGENVDMETFATQDKINSDHFKAGLNFIRDSNPGKYKNIIRAIENKEQIADKDFEDIAELGQEVVNFQVYRGAATDPSLIGKETNIGYSGTSYQSKKSEAALAIGEYLKDKKFTSKEYSAKEIRDAANKVGITNKEIVNDLIFEEGLPLYDAIPKAGTIEAFVRGLETPLAAIKNTIDVVEGDATNTYLRSQQLDVGFAQKVKNAKGQVTGELPSERGNVWYDAIEGFGQFIPQVILAKGFGGAIAGEINLVSKTGLSAAQTANVTNYAGTFISSYLQEYGGAYEDALQKTGDPATAKAMGAINGISAAAFELVLPDVKIAENASKLMRGGYAKDIVDFIKKGGNPAELAKKGRPLIEKFVGETLDIGRQEVSEELGTQVVNYLTEAIFSPKTVNDRDLGSELLETAKATAISMIVPAVLGAGGTSISKDFSVNGLHSAAINFNESQAALNRALVDDNISQDEYNKALVLLKTHKNSIVNSPEVDVNGKELTTKQRLDFAYQETQVKINEKKSENVKGVQKEILDNKIKQAEDIQRIIVMPEEKPRIEEGVVTEEGETSDAMGKEEIKAAKVLAKAGLPDLYAVMAETDPVSVLKDIAKQAQNLNDDFIPHNDGKEAESLERAKEYFGEYVVNEAIKLYQPKTQTNEEAKTNEANQTEVLTPEPEKLVEQPPVSSVEGGEVDFTAKAGNKLVDENGQPLTVYHGSREGMSEFDETKIGTNDKGFYGKGIYFAPTKEHSEMYTGDVGDKKPQNVKSYHIDIKNPYTIDVKDMETLYGKEIPEGYDGVIVTSQGQPYEYVVKNKSQIKPAEQSQPKGEAAKQPIAKNEKETTPISDTPKNQTADIGTSQKAGKAAEEGTRAKTTAQKGKEQFHAKVDKAAASLIKALTPKTTTGVKKQGIGVEEIVKAAANIIKTAYDVGSDIKVAIEEAIKYVKDHFSANDLGDVDDTVLRDHFEGMVNERDENGKERRQFSEQVLSDKKILPQVKRGVENAIEYTKQTNRMSIAEAEEILNRVGEDEAFRLITLNDELKPAVRVVLGQVLIKKYNELSKEAKDSNLEDFYIDKTIDVANYVSEKLGTESGQMIQAFSLWSGLTPEAQLRSASKEKREQGKKNISKVKKDIDKVGDKLQQANEEAAEELINSKKKKKSVENVENLKVKKAKDKIKTAQNRRNKLIEERKKGKGGALFSSVSGLTPEGIEFVGNVAATYIQEGVARVEVIVQKISEHLKEISGKDLTEGVDKNVRDIITELVEKDQNKKIVSGLSEMEKEVSRIVKEHYTIPESAKTSLKDKFVKETGLDEELSAQLGKDIQDEFEAIVKRKKDRILYNEKARFDKIQKELGTKKERKTIEDAVLKYSNLGAFDNADFTDFLAKKLEVGRLTPEEAKAIVALSEKIQKAPEGSPKNDATQELLSYRANMKGIKLMETLQAVWYANILSGYATHLRNIVSTFFNGMAFFGAEAFRDPRSIPVLVYGGARGVNRGVREAWHTISTGKSPIHVLKVETPGTLERQGFIGGWFNPYNYLKFVGRLMVAEDVLQFQALKEMRATQLAYREAKKKGSKNPFSKETWKIINEKLLNTKERSDAAFAQANEEGLKEKSVERKRRIYELMENSRSIEMTEDAYGFAARGTFNFQPEGTLGAITNVIGTALNFEVSGARPLRFFVPFTRIITNVVNNALDFGPVGLIRAARGGSVLTGDKFRQLTPEQKNQLIARASLGIAMTGAMYALTKVPCKDGHNVLDITGAGTGDFTKDAQLKATGWQPYSIRVCGGSYFSYKYTPLIFNLGFLGYMNDTEKYGKPEGNTFHNVMGALYQTGQLALDGTWVGSTSDVMKTLSESSPSQLAKNLEKTVSNMALQAILPNAYVQGAQTTEEWLQLPQKDAKTLYERLIQHIPIARNSLNNKINALGEDIPTDIDIFISERKPHRVFDYLTSKKSWVTPVNRNSLIVHDVENNIERPATNEEYYKFSKIRGQKIKEDVESLLDDGAKITIGIKTEEKTAQELTTSDLNKLMRNIKTNASKEAKAEMFGAAKKKPKFKIELIEEGE